MASNTPHSLATEHLPMFVSGPGETDGFFIAVVVITILATMSVGLIYFTLHSLPERMAHKVNSNQVLLIGVMSLVAMFTHNNYFFIGALFLAVVRLPDWTTSFNSIAKSLEAQAERERDEDPADSHQQVDLPMVAPAPDSSALAELEDRAERERDEDPADSHQQVDLPMVAPAPDSSALAEKLKGN